jgi:hypothetical protein
MKDNYMFPKAMEKGSKNNWGFIDLPYDQRSGIFVNAGVNYGVGKPQPKGRKNEKK